MIRFTAKYRSEGRIDEIRSVYFTGILFEVCMGLALSLFSFLFADYLASLFSRPDIAPLIQIVSFSILAQGIVAAATAAFTGYERLELNSVMLVFQSIFKTAIIIALVIFGFGTAGATIGFTAGIFIAAAIGVALIGVIYRQLPKPVSRKLEIKAYFSAMFAYCLPLSFATMITVLLPQFYAFLLPIHYATDNVPIGNYGVAVNFSVLVAFFIMPITTMMFPVFSKLDPEKDRDDLRNIFKFSVKYGSLLVVPVTALVMSLAEPAVETLFGVTYNTAALFLALFVIQYLYIAIGNGSLGSLLNGQGKTGFVLRMALVTGLIGFPLGYFFIMSFGVLGLIIATLVSVVPAMIMGLIYVRKTFGMTVDWGSSARILLSSAITGSLTFVVVSYLPFAAWLRLLLGVAVFVLLLVPSILLSHSITHLDIANLKVMVGGLGPLGELIKKILSLLERIMNILKL